MAGRSSVRRGNGDEEREGAYQHPHICRCDEIGSRGEFITHWDDGDIDTFYVFYRKGSSPFTGIKNGPLAQTVRAADS